MLAQLAAILCAEAPRSAPEYYPRPAGTRWTFTTADGVEVVHRVTRVDAGAATVEVSIRGKVEYRETLQTKADGVYRLVQDGKPVDPPACILKLPVKAGETWAAGGATFTVEEATITVPAGSYESAVRVRCRYSEGGEAVEIVTWYAPGVGPVAMRVKRGDRVLHELELVKFGPRK